MPLGWPAGRHRRDDKRGSSGELWVRGTRGGWLRLQRTTCYSANASTDIDEVSKDDVDQPDPNICAKFAMVRTVVVSAVAGVSDPTHRPLLRDNLRYPSSSYPAEMKSPYATYSLQRRRARNTEHRSVLYNTSGYRTVLHSSRRPVSPIKNNSSTNLPVGSLTIAAQKQTAWCHSAARKKKRKKKPKQTNERYPQTL